MALFSHIAPDPDTTLQHGKFDTGLARNMNRFIREIFNVRCQQCPSGVSLVCQDVQELHGPEVAPILCQFWCIALTIFWKCGTIQIRSPVLEEPVALMQQRKKTIPFGIVRNRRHACLDNILFD